MAAILVLYGTSEGQTARIALAIGDMLQAQGITAPVVDAAERSPRPDEFDAVIVAASIHAGGFQRSVRRWIRAHAGTLNAKPTAFVCVCLSVLQKDPKVRRDLAGIIERFLAGAGWRPTITRTVAGALPYTRYNPLTRWVMKRIAAAAGGDTDTSRDYEYTDWEDVRSFASTFARQVTGDRAARVA
jgi:menaquinone-dependent protoporphyrinogen oxidase